jgi:membrane-associated phospholipid phosphatase
MAKREEDYSIDKARQMRTSRTANNMNTFERDQSVNTDVSTMNTPALFSKTLDHDSTTLLPSEANVVKLALAMERGTRNDLENVQLSPNATRKLANPLGAFICEVMGCDAYGFTMPVPPTLDSVAGAGEMVEVYEQNIQRDISFDELNFGGANTAADRAVTNLNAFGSEYKGPVNSVSGALTRAELFRGVAPGCLTGPYVSQFLLHDFKMGAHTISQKYDVHTGVYGNTSTNFKSIADGGVPVAQGANEATAQYIWNGKGLGTLVHGDFIYQQFYYAAAMLAHGGTRHTAYSDNDPSNSGAFLTNGGPAFVAPAVAAVSSHALSASWVHKWRHHCKLRPETMAARIVTGISGATTQYHDSALTTNAQSTLDAVKAFNVANGGDNAEFLPMLYAEGSPTHPAYPAGHAVIAGANATILKLVYADTNWSTMGNYSAVQHSTDGNSLVTYSRPDAGDVTVHGELNKLAANMAIGRNIAGVHYRSDGDCGMMLGQKVAIAYFEDYLSRLIEPTGDITITGFDGVDVTISV